MAPQLSRAQHSHEDVSKENALFEERRTGQQFGRRWNDATSRPIPVETTPVQSQSRGLQRLMTREHGRALEMLGHAVDYLEDSYIEDGPENEIILVASTPDLQAVQILANARREMLASLPLVEPFFRRFWKAIFRRNMRPVENTVDMRSVSYPSHPAVHPKAESMVR